jgi:DNA polymerase elongation subunit (family B)
MMKRENLKNILVLDIETVSSYPDYKKMPENWQKLWDKKAQYLKSEEQTSEDVYERAGIYSEFGKIICITVAAFVFVGEEVGVRLKSFYSDDEKKLLVEFTELLNTKFDHERFALCGHNGKEFDFPYIARRMLVHGVPLPKILQMHGKKPWEIHHLDTMELWKFGDYKKYTSLELLATLFNIPTPKDDIDGSQVGPVYWKDNDLERIKDYCVKDVVTTSRLLLKLLNLGDIKEKYIEIL